MSARYPRIRFAPIALVGLLGAAAPQDAEPTQDELSERYERWLEGEWLQLADWEVDYDRARELAAESGKRIFVYFSVNHLGGGLCAELEQGLFSSEGFAEWSEPYVLLAHFTKRSKDRPHEGLFRELCVTGYPPQMAMLDADGQLLARRGGMRERTELRELDAAAAAYAALREEAEAGDEDARHRLLVADLRLERYRFDRGLLVYEAARARMTPELRAQAEQALTDTLCRVLYAELEADYRAGMSASEYTRRQVAIDIELFRAGRVPSGVDGLVVLFHAIEDAKQNEDREAYDRATEQYQARLVAMGSAAADEVASEPEELPDFRASVRTVDQFVRVVSDDELAVALATAADLLVELQEVVPGEDSADGTPQVWPYESSDDHGNVAPATRAAGTAIVCRALVLAPGYEAAPERQRAARRATDYLLAALRDEPRLRPERGGEMSCWAHTYALEYFLEALDRELFDEETARRMRAMIPTLIEWIAANEGGWPAGGWHYNSNDPCSPFMTGATLLALYRARAAGFAVDERPIGTALAGLENVRLGDGAFDYSGGYQPASKEKLFAPDMAGVPGSCARAAAAELGLYGARRSDARRLRFAVTAFFEYWDELAAQKSRPGKHGKPYGIAPYYFMFGHAYAARAIEVLPEEERPAWRARMRAALWRTREADGGWNESLIARNKSYSTAMAMLALMAPRVERARTWELTDGR